MGPRQTPTPGLVVTLIFAGLISLQPRSAAAVAVNAPLTRGAPARKLGPLQHIQNLTQKTKEGLVVARDLNPADPAGQSRFARIAVHEDAGLEHQKPEPAHRLQREVTRRRVL